MDKEELKVTGYQNTDIFGITHEDYAGGYPKTQMIYAINANTKTKTGRFILSSYNEDIEDIKKMYMICLFRVVTNSYPLAHIRYIIGVKITGIETKETGTACEFIFDAVTDNISFNL